MTEPTVGPLSTDSTPVTPAQAPLTDVPAPVVTEDTHGRGRIASPRTVYIRKLLEDSDGEITYSNALPLLQAAGYDVDQNTFNVTKSAWKRAKRSDAPKANTAPKTKTRKVKAKVKVNLPTVTVTEAIAFVEKAGGLAKAEANVLRDRACLKAFKLLVKQTSKLAA